MGQSVLEVCIMFGSAPVWQVVGGVYEKKWDVMAVVNSVCEESG